MMMTMMMIIMMTFHNVPPGTGDTGDTEDDLVSSMEYDGDMDRDMDRNRGIFCKNDHMYR